MGFNVEYTGEDSFSVHFDNAPTGEDIVRLIDTFLGDGTFDSMIDDFLQRRGYVTFQWFPEGES